MVAYSFAARFIVPITAGTKHQTIRKPRRGQARPGSTLQLYYAQRSPFRRLLGTATCRIVRPIALVPHPDHGEVFDFSSCDGITSREHLENFAHKDGFESWADLCAFWAEVHPGVGSFQGDLIEWEAFELPAPEPDIAPEPDPQTPDFLTYFRNPAEG